MSVRLQQTLWLGCVTVDKIFFDQLIFLAFSEITDIFHYGRFHIIGFRVL